MSGKCPTPTKQAHPSEQVAQDHLWSLRRREGKAGTFSLRVYKCKCGSWHVGGFRKKSPNRKRVQR